MGVLLSITSDLNRDLRCHLFKDNVEQLAFLLAKRQHANSDEFQLTELYLVPADGFEIQSRFHISLLPEIRAKVIKWAWDRQASLIEAHSHRGQVPAAFSPSDLSGFEEFVPHVWWRLQGKPYAALVFTHESFDGLVWMTSPSSPLAIEALCVEGEGYQRPTGLTMQRPRWTENDL
jgi:hypothetical protein